MDTFGEILQKLRISKSISQEDLGILANCSTRTIMRIENNQVTISPHLMHTISNIFNIDLNQYNSIVLDYGSYENYILCKQIRTTIIKREFNQLSSIIDELTINETSTEIVILWATYANAVKLLYIENDSIKTLDFLIQSFHINDVSDFSTLEINNVYCEPYTSILILLCGVLDINGHTFISNHLTKVIFDIFNKDIFSENLILYQFEFDFRRKYITLINNYAHVCFENNEIEKCLELVSLGIEKCKEFETLHAIEYLYCLQCQALYLLHDYESCKESLTFFETFCKLKNNYTLYEKIFNKYKFKFD